MKSTWGDAWGDTVRVRYLKTIYGTVHHANTKRTRGNSRPFFRSRRMNHRVRSRQGPPNSSRGHTPRNVRRTDPGTDTGRYSRTGSGYAVRQIQPHIRPGRVPGRARTRQEHEDGPGRENTRPDRRNATGSRYALCSGRSWDPKNRSWRHQEPPGRAPGTPERVHPAGHTTGATERLQGPGDAPQGVGRADPHPFPVDPGRAHPLRPISPHDLGRTYSPDKPPRHNPLHTTSTVRVLDQSKHPHPSGRSPHFHSIRLYGLSNEMTL